MVIFTGLLIICNFAVLAAYSRVIMSVSLMQEGHTITVFNSQDEGQTWGQPHNFFKSFNVSSPFKDIEVTALKPGCAHGIQIEADLCEGGCQEAGRLLLPMVCTNKSAHGSHTDKGCTTCLACNIFSDDGGRSWTVGGVGQVGTRESALVQLSSSTRHAELYVNERNMGASPGHRLIAHSNDGGQTYGGYAMDKQLTSPVTPHWTGIVAGVNRFTTPSTVHPLGELIFTSPFSTTSRANLTARVSTDEGRSWDAPKVIWSGPSGYSDAAQVGDQSMAVIFENGDTGFAERISVSVLSKTWLTDPYE